MPRLFEIDRRLRRAWARPRSTSRSSSARPAQDRAFARQGHCPVSGRGRERAVSCPAPARVSGRRMLTWDSMSKWGRRASDTGATAPAAPTRDLLLEAAIAHEQVDVLFQPLIEPARAASSAPRRWRARPLSPDAPTSCSRGPCRRPVSTSGCRGWSSARRCAAPRCGKARSRISACRSTCLPADLSRDGYDDWLLDEIDAAGIDPARITAEITESALLADQRSRRRPPGPAARRRHPHRGRRFRHRLRQPRLSDLAAARRDQDRPRADRRHRRRRARPIVVKALIHLARELDLKVVVEGVETAAQLALLAEWGCDLYQGFLGAGALKSR